jgi:GTP-binding protein
VDKLKRSEREPTLGALAAQLGVDDEQLIPFSAHTGEGRYDLAHAIVSVLSEPSWREE